MGMDRPPQVQVLGFGANVSYTPGFSTQQTDLQRVRRNATRRIDGYVAWRFDRQTQLRLAVQNLAAVDAVTVNTVLDLDGFTALNRQVRPYQTVVNLSLVSRF